MIFLFQSGTTIRKVKSSSVDFSWNLGRDHPSHRGSSCCVHLSLFHMQAVDKRGMHKSWPSIQFGCLKLGFDIGNYFFFIVRRLSGAPFVVSAVFLPQRVQFLADSGWGLLVFLPTSCSYRIGLRYDGIVDNCNML